jgi:hypothetical protein
VIGLHRKQRHWYCSNTLMATLAGTLLKSKFQTKSTRIPRLRTVLPERATYCNHSTHCKMSSSVQKPNTLDVWASEHCYLMHVLHDPFVGINLYTWFRATGYKTTTASKFNADSSCCYKAISNRLSAEQNGYVKPDTCIYIFDVVSCGISLGRRHM